MKQISQFLGALFVLIGIFFLVAPEVVLGWLEDNGASTSTYVFAIVARLLFGLLFVLAAKESQFPGVIKILGYLLIIAAVIFVAIGHQKFQQFFSAVIPMVKPYAPITGLVVVAFGGFIVYAFSGKKD